MMRTKSMTNELQARQEVVLSIIKSMTIKTALLVGIGVIAAFAYTLTHQNGSWWSMPASLFFGGALGLLNFRWLAFAVERKLAKRIQTAGPANPALVLLNLLKLSAIFIVLFVVIKWQLVNIFGLVIGLTLSFLAVIWEGLTIISRMHQDEK